MTDQHALSRVLREFARTMAGAYDITQVVHDLSERVVEVLGATAAGVALLDGDQLRFISATSDVGAEAERLQEELQNGPCLDSIEQDQPVLVPDVRDAHDRWPEYCRAVDELGVRAVLALPLVLNDRRVGSLDVYDAEPRQWADDEVEAGRVLADIGAAYVLNVSQLAESQRTADQLQTALDTRIVIEQAKGVLAERLGVSPSDAFDRIRTAARGQGQKVVVLCRRVIEEGYVPE